MWIGITLIPASRTTIASTTAFVKLLNEEIFDSLDDACRKLALWRYDYNNVRPPSSTRNQTHTEASRALQQLKGSANDVLAQNEATDYKIKVRKLSL